MTTGYLALFMNVLLSAYGQNVIKWRVMKRQDSSGVTYISKFIFYGSFLLDIFILSAVAVAFIRFPPLWLYILSKFDLSYAYPFMSLNFVIILITSQIFFGEKMNKGKVAGVVLICCGISLMSI